METEKIEHYLQMQDIYTFFLDKPILNPEVFESSFLPENVCEKRKIEFMNGRYCIRNAIKKMKFDFNEIIPIGLEGEPILPEYIAGSISHSKNYFIACVSKKENYVSIGVDIEKLDRKFNEKAFKLIASNEELKYKNDNITRLLIFSLKESVIKALFMVIKRKIFFSDIFFKEILFNKNQKIFKELNPLFSKKYSYLFDNYFIKSEYFLSDDFVFSITKIKKK